MHFTEPSDSTLAGLNWPDVREEKESIFCVACYVAQGCIPCLHEDVSYSFKRIFFYRKVMFVARLAASRGVALCYTLTISVAFNDRHQLSRYCKLPM